MQSSTQSPEPKRTKNDELDPSLPRQLIACEHHGEPENENELTQDELDEILLNSDEEEECLSQVYTNHDYASSDSAGTPSPDDGGKSGNTDDQGAKRSPVQTRSIKLQVPSHEALLHFLHRFKIDGLDKTKPFPTCLWNSCASEVYSLFNVSTSIVPPNYFLASEESPDNTTLSILNTLERSKRRFSWSYLKQNLEVFLDGFEGFENLANVFKKPQIAAPLIAKFHELISHVQESVNEKPGPGPGWYSVFADLAELLEGGTSTCCVESTFHQYIQALINQLNIIALGHYSLKSSEISLVVPAHKSFPELSFKVKPDFMLLAPLSACIMLVGEVKKFGSHGALYEEYRGHRVKEVEPDTDQHQGQGDQLPPTVKEKDYACASSTTATEPLASTTTGIRASNTKKRKSTLPVRSLNFRENYKVNCYLPQLFGQMLAAMHFNTSTGKSSNFKLRTRTKNVQLGFAVEGFKLRFVKLTLYDAINNGDKSEYPTVEALLRGKRLKCDICMTQEYNLLKRSHLEMFYQMLLAISYMYK